VLAEGEFQAAQRLADAAGVLASHPMGLQLRYLQTIAEITGDRNSTTIFPLPIDLLKPFLDMQEFVRDQAVEAQAVEARAAEASAAASGGSAPPAALPPGGQD